MELQDYARVLRARWITIAVTTAIAVLAALAYSLASTPMYEASTRLFVSTTDVSSVNEALQGGQFSQQRVLSYTKLVTGETLAKRTINKMNLDLTPTEFAQKVTATAALNTVLIDVSVRDEIPARAMDIANVMSEEFVNLVQELETPKKGADPTARVVVEQTADLPTKPVLPTTKRNLALGAVLGLLLGVGGAILRDRLDNTVKDRTAVEEITQTGLIGTIPFDKRRQQEAAIR
ncbi:MAG: protein tyrosine kinase, partial [Nocardiaceae bacterium]|nr:protein tyrosine kinase [Nocardiaceae bacterium]